MDKYVYATNSSKIKPFLGKIRTVGIPGKVDKKYLASIGFKDQNDRRLISIIKAIGFVSSAGIPTERWKNYRDKEKAGYILAEGIRENYAELFKIYPDANTQSFENLLNFFTSKTELAKRTLKYVVVTFKNLVELADFKKVVKPAPSPEKEIKKPQADLLTRQIEKQGYIVNINIQLTLPETTNTATYEAIFAAMKKHLLS